MLQFIPPSYAIQIFLLQNKRKKFLTRRVRTADPESPGDNTAHTIGFDMGRML